MSETGTAPAPRAQVELRVPADSAYALVLRTTAAALAARLDFTIDDIEDLRMAVAEATALALEQADAGAELVCRFALGPADLTVSLDVAAADAVHDQDSFAWQVLVTLAARADVRTHQGRITVTLAMASTAGGADG